MTSWQILLAVAGVIVMLALLLKHFRAERERHGARHGRDDHRAIGTGSRRDGTAGLRRAAAGSHDHDTGSSWYGWIAGLGTLLAVAGIFSMNKCDAIKQAMTSPAEDVSGNIKAMLTKKVEAAAASVETAKTEVATKTVAELKPAAVAAEVVAKTAAPVPGVTSYYGVSDGSRVLPWSAEAAFNPDYTVAETVAEAAAPSEPEAQAGDAEGSAPAAGEPVAAEPQVAPVSLGGLGVTSYYGNGQTPDAGQPWAAQAQMNPDYVVAEPVAPAAAETQPAAVAKAVPGVTSYYGGGESWTAPETYYAPAEVAAVPKPAPAKIEPGVTSLYESSSWTAPENYYAPVDVVAVPEPVLAMTPPGVTSNYASGQSWTAPVNYYAPVDTCSDSVAAALKSGKLNFATSSWEILDDSFPTLDKIAKLIKGCNGASVVVGGHTDNTGSVAGNQTLSQQRAQAVVKYLSGAGVDTSQLKAVGYGQDKPIADNATSAGKRENRRIEFVVTAK